jgi:hypothetical protein
VHRERPVPPRPDLVRRPVRGFGWLDARLLHEGWLSRLGPDATAALTFLALAADERGASFYGRGRMATTLGIEPRALDRALDRLVAVDLVAYRPWRAGHCDGVWQLLPIPAPAPRDRASGPSSLRDILGSLGLTPPRT